MRRSLAHYRLALPVLFALVLPAAAGAQSKQVGAKEDIDPKFTVERGKFTKLLAGEQAVDPAKDKALIELAARYYVWRVTWPTVLADRASQHEALAQFERDMQIGGAALPKNKDLMKLFGKELVTAFKPVLALDFAENAQAVSNGALLLPSLGKCKQEEVGDYLNDLVKDDKLHPFVRMCAVKALREFFPARVLKFGEDVRDDKNLADKLARDLARLQTVVAFMDNPYKLQDNPTKEQFDAWIFLRREAVKTLAQVQVPALGLTKDKVAGPTAYYLLRVLGPLEKGQVPFGLTEKVEAAVGLAQLRGQDDIYQADPAVYAVGVLLLELANVYQLDYQYFSIKGDKKDPPRVSRLPWRAVATRLKLGLEEWKASLPKDSTAAKKVTALLNDADTLFLAMAPPGGAIQKRLEDPVVLRQTVQGMAPASAELYKGINIKAPLPPPPAN